MFQQATEQGVKFQALGDMKMDYLETESWVESHVKYNKKILATVKNPYLAQLGLEAVRMMELSMPEITMLYKAVKAPTSIF